MNFISSLNTVSGAMFQLIFLAGCGFVLVKRNILPPPALQALSRIIIVLIFPLFIFNKLINNFTFAQFPRWWVYPLFSFAIIVIGFLFGYLSLRLNPEFREKREFLSSVTFSNAGYLPLILIAALFESQVASQIFMYLFLYLLGFNLLIWSLGVILLAGDSRGKNNIKLIFNPPVIAILAGLVIVFFKMDAVLPAAFIKSIGSLGACALPLAMIVVGGNLALIKMESILKNTELQLIVLIKLILMPFFVLLIVLFLNINPLVKFLLLLEAAMPTAVSLSVICRNFNLGGKLANQAIFWTHICSIVTLPFFLILFKALTGLA